MWFIKKILLSLLILFVLYILALFVFPDQTRWFGDSIWLKKFNDFIINFKSKVDDASINTDVEKTIKNIQSWATDLLDTAWDYAKDIKSKIDSVRSTASWVENTYNEVKWQIEETRKNIEDVSNKFNQMKQTVDSVNIFN